MAQRHVLKLMAGFRKFRESFFVENAALYDKLASDGQAPKFLVISCSDSRVDPAILSSASPGDMFVVRNVANLVPPYETSEGYHGVSSAIEFAVANLKVETVIVLGHRQCGGIRALVTSNSEEPKSFVQKWVRIAASAKERVMKRYAGSSEDELCRHCEMEAIVTSVENLKSFPFVQEALSGRSMEILGLYFDLEKGELWELDQALGEFKLLDL